MSDSNVYKDALNQAIKDLSSLECEKAETDAKIANIRRSIISLKLAAGETVTNEDFGYASRK